MKFVNLVTSISQLLLKKKEFFFSQKFRILFKKTQMNPPRESPFHPLHNRTIVQPISVSLQRLAKYFYIVLVSLGIQVQVQLLKKLKNYNYFSSQNSHKKM